MIIHTMQNICIFGSGGDVEFQIDTKIASLVELSPMYVHSKLYQRRRMELTDDCRRHRRVTVDGTDRRRRQEKTRDDDTGRH